MVIRKEEVIKKYENIKELNLDEKYELYENMNILRMKSRKETESLKKEAELENFKQKIEEDLEMLKRSYELLFCFDEVTRNIITKMAVEKGVISAEIGEKREKQIEAERKEFIASIHKLERDEIKEISECESEFEINFEPVMEDMLFYAEWGMEDELEKSYKLKDIESLFDKIESKDEEEQDMILETYYSYFPDRAEKIYDKIVFLENDRIKKAVNYKNEVNEYSDEKLQFEYEYIKTKDREQGLWYFEIEQEDILFNELKNRGINIERDEANNEESLPNPIFKKLFSSKKFWIMLFILAAVSIYWYIKG